VASLALLSEVLNYDFAQHDLDDPVTEEMTDAGSGIRGLADGVRRHLDRDDLTVRDLAAHRATLLQGPRFVGTAEQVADQMQEWFEGGACDGFIIAFSHLPGGLDDFARLVMPELRRRSLFRAEYEGKTLRENLGLERPNSRYVNSA
jgi:alkanesulfonate monooxygenase SsuD/methylene tetrahydromethanopterin reductase-like flavin-dependent oxidoreductase (luciferase family)